MSDIQYFIRPALESDMPWIEERIRRTGLDNEELFFHEFWVVEYESQPVAFGRLKFYPDFFEIADVFVEESMRNRGIGSFLVRNLLDLEPGAVKYVTTVIPAYFKRFGFRSTDDVPNAISSKIARIVASRRQEVVVMEIKGQVDMREKLQNPSTRIMQLPSLLKIQG